MICKPIIFKKMKRPSNFIKIFRNFEDHLEGIIILNSKIGLMMEEKKIQQKEADKISENLEIEYIFKTIDKIQENIK